MGGERYAAPVTLRGWKEAAGRAIGGEAAGTLLALDLAGATAEVGIARDGSVRLRAARGDALPPLPEEVVERGPWRPVDANPRQRGGGLLALVTPNAPVGVEIRADPFSLRVLDRRRACVCTLQDLRFGADGGTRIAMPAQAGERFLGLGEKAGSLDHRGRALTMRNRDPWLQRREPLYASIPYLLVHRSGSDGPGSCGVLLDAFGTSHFDVAAEADDRVTLETASGGVDLMLFPGPTPRDVTRRFTARVGRTPLPPLWALGHHQSRWSYGSESQVRALARELRSRRIPTDAIHLDIDYMAGFRVFTWDPKRFPDPTGLMRALSHEGLRTVAIVDPGVKVDPAYEVYARGLERGAFCLRPDGSLFTFHVWPGESALPDFNRADVRAWWGDLHASLLDAGVAGIWNDMNEPSGWRADVRLGRSVLPVLRGADPDFEQSDPWDADHKLSHERVHNLYGHQECRATREALEKQGCERRPFVLTRSGYAGIQRYAALWTGDNRSRWEDLRESIPMLQNLSLSGVAFCGADIGGFFGSCTPELYARWIQLGALYPFSRTHSSWTGRRQEPWRFGRRVERIAREALELRMRLLPYLYGLFRHAERTGDPVWRPLVYEFPDDPASAAVPDQLMLGSCLLAAPVVERGARARDLYLPPGTWIDWHDGGRYEGARQLRVDAPLSRLPLFVRGGSVLPTQSPVRNVRERPDEPLVLEVFPGGDASFELVEDDGETLAYRGEVVSRSALRLWSNAGGRLRLEVGRREGPFAIATRPLRVRFHACPSPEAVYLDGTPLASGSGRPGYGVCADGRIDVRLVDEGAGLSVEIDPAP